MRHVFIQITCLSRRLEVSSNGIDYIKPPGSGVSALASHSMLNSSQCPQPVLLKTWPARNVCGNLLTLQIYDCFPVLFIPAGVMPQYADAMSHDGHDRAIDDLTRNGAKMLYSSASAPQQASTVMPKHRKPSNVPLVKPILGNLGRVRGRFL